jgi:hypothetical protein
MPLSLPLQVRLNFERVEAGNAFAESHGHSDSHQLQVDSKFDEGGNKTLNAESG